MQTHSSKDLRRKRGSQGFRTAIPQKVHRPLGEPRAQPARSRAAALERPRRERIEHGPWRTARDPIAAPLRLAAATSRADCRGIASRPRLPCGPSCAPLLEKKTAPRACRRAPSPLSDGWGLIAPIPRSPLPRPRPPPRPRQTPRLRPQLRLRRPPRRRSPRRWR